MSRGPRSRAGETGFGAPEVPRFDRSFFGSDVTFTRIGNGGIGGKAAGLARVGEILETRFDRGAHPDVDVAVPRLTVIATDVFETFVEANGLGELAGGDEPDERIALAFQRGEIPAEVVGDLRALIEGVRTPLAVRSSSLLEDAMYRPFAGVYGTKMIPNNQPDADGRFRRLAEAVKFVWASTYFRDARDYVRATDRSIRDERMAVVVQEVVGARHDTRFYPEISGVARSYDFYPMADASPENGVVNLALGLGKTIVDGGLSWTYSPTRPKALPPFASARDLVDNTQSAFWAVHMGKPPAYDPIRETEYLVQAGLRDADLDGTLRYVASTYDARSDRLTAGVANPGPRAVTFAPILVLQEIPLNAVIRDLLAMCQDVQGDPVEIEFAVTLAGGGRARFGFLQMRPMVVSHTEVEVAPGEMTAPGVLAASEAIMGNGVDGNIHDVVYVRPDRFETRLTRAIADEIAAVNNRLVAEARPYVLIGFGRWGSADPWLGIPVQWGQICGARAIVEATRPELDVDPSQGSHFFHNLSSFRVGYLAVHHNGRYGIDWAWLEGQPAVTETEHVRHVRTDAPLTIRLDGRRRRGVIARTAEGAAP